MANDGSSVVWFSRWIFGIVWSVFSLVCVLTFYRLSKGCVRTEDMARR